MENERARKKEHYWATAWRRRWCEEDASTLKRPHITEIVDTMHNLFVFRFISFGRCARIFLLLFEFYYYYYNEIECNALSLFDSIFLFVPFERQFQLLSVIWCILAEIWFSLCFFSLWFLFLLSLSIYPCNTRYMIKMLNHRQRQCMQLMIIKLQQNTTETREREREAHER